MTNAQETFLERLLLSSAIPPAVRKDARRVMADPEVGVEQVTMLIDRVKQIMDEAPPKDQRPAAWRVASLQAKVKYYNRRGSKASIKPLVADIEWLAEQKEVAQ